LDFGASDMPMTDQQLAAAKVKLMHVPTVLGAVVPIYNIPGVSKTLNFSGDVIADIYLGKIKMWNDPRIAKDNPGVSLPEQGDSAGVPLGRQRHDVYLYGLSVEGEPGLESEGRQQHLGQVARRYWREGQ
jgi:hypothetical protein